MIFYDISFLVGLLRSKVDLENSSIQVWSSNAAFSTVYIKLLQMILIAFSSKYNAQRIENNVSLNNTSKDNVIRKGTTLEAGKGKNDTDSMLEHGDGSNNTTDEDRDGDEWFFKIESLIFLFEIIRFLLQLAYYVAIVIIVIGIIDMTKTLPDVPPPSRGDPAVL